MIFEKLVNLLQAGTLTWVILTAIATNFLISASGIYFTLRKTFKQTIVIIISSLVLRLFVLSFFYYKLINANMMNAFPITLFFIASYNVMTFVELAWLYKTTKNDYTKGVWSSGTS
ncbi:MAG: hypothetical protein C4562_01240 [Actinobacteria bacterium]|nr:MAG: hypothetical protein C4562_01240 [Actinomycetota bacterium]